MTPTPRQARDLSRKQFLSALARRGIKPDAFGYFDIGNGVHSYARNGGSRRRSQLAYLIRQKERHTK